MRGELVLQIVPLVSFIVFVTLFLLRIMRMSRFPFHLRWEIYPIPGRNGYQADMKDLEGQRQSGYRRHLQEIKYMASEILLFRTHYRRKRDYWYLVYPLHLSMYLFLAWSFMIGAGSLLSIAGVTVSSQSRGWGRILFYATVFAGGASFSMGLVSSAGLLVKRVIQKDLRFCTTPVIYFNLLFALAICATGFINWFWFDTSFSIFREYVEHIAQFDSGPASNPVMTVHILLLSLFMIYLPLSRMMHFVAKYFIFHKVLWESERGTPETSSETDVRQRVVTWSAPHISSNK
jgi:nitrate reductase gamma subunit